MPVALAVLTGVVVELISFKVGIAYAATPYHSPSSRGRRGRSI
jgi:hypothetical protein